MGGGAVLWRSFYHKPTPPQGQEARFVCRGLGFEEIVPQETLAPALFSSSLVELTAPVHPFFSSPSRVCREELKTWVLVLRPSSTRGLLNVYSACASLGLSFLLCTNKVGFTLWKCVCPASHPSPNTSVLCTENPEMERQIPSSQSSHSYSVKIEICIRVPGC